MIVRLSVIAKEQMRTNGDLEPLARCFMNCFGETMKMGVPPGNRRVLDPRRT